MISLIKNELIKIFHKKAIYVLGIITLVFAMLNIVIIKFVDNVDDLFTNDQYYQTLEDNLASYDLKNTDEVKWYIQDKTDIELYKAAKKYDTDSWQDVMFKNNAYSYIFCMNEAEYITKDNEKYDGCKKDYEALIEKLDNSSWQDFVLQDKKDAEEQLAQYEEQLKRDLTESEKSSLDKEIQKLKYQIEGYDYRLKYEIPYDESEQSYLINNYVNSAQTYLDYNKDENSYVNRKELLEKRSVEESFYVSKYKLENNIGEKGTFEANASVISEFSTPILFVIVVIVMVAGSIVSEEYNKGTIKQLLLRPYGRAKILFSKYCASVVVFLLFMLFYGVVSAVTYGVASGFDTLVAPNIIYNFSTHSVMEMNLLLCILAHVAALLPEYLLLLTIAFFISTVLGNTALSVTVTLLIYVFSSIINAIIVSYNVNILKYFPTLCWDFSEYLFGGIPSFKYASFVPSVVDCCVCYIILLVLSFIIFKRKNIKNQ